jgi:hypothetical protein
MHLAGTATPTVATYRAVDTALGGALALLVYRLWPTWEAGRTRDLLAQLSEVLADDARLALGMYVDPATWNTAKLQQSRAAARLARSNAEASVTRMLAEPERTSRLDAELATSLLAAFRRYALGALVLHGGLEQRPAAPAGELTAIRHQLAGGLAAIAAALRHGGHPTLPSPAETQASLDQALDRTMAEQLSILADSVATAGSLLGAG